MTTTNNMNVLGGGRDVFFTVFLQKMKLNLTIVSLCRCLTKHTTHHPRSFRDHEVVTRGQTFGFSSEVQSQFTSLCCLFVKQEEIDYSMNLEV